MSIPFRVGRYISPSGFALAVVDVPQLDPEKNISIIDYSHRWEENVSSAETSLVKSYVDAGGYMPSMTVTDFLVTNETSLGTNDTVENPLWYRHECRFYHYTYGENPAKQVYITDAKDNILKNVNYSVKVSRISANVYRVYVLTDFKSNEYAQYRVKYNRCTISGDNIQPGWTEALNADKHFNPGSPFINSDEYYLSGPDDDGLYRAVVPPVPTLSSLINTIGISFENSPTILAQNSLDYTYPYSTTVIYTIRALGTTTFSVRRSCRPDGASTTDIYLQSATVKSWGTSAHAFTIGTTITSIEGVKLYVHGDNYLKAGDEAYFTAKQAYYYLMPVSYNAIYLAKPKHVTPEDDWYIGVKNGRFRRTMDSNGNVVPSGQGTTYEYGIPEYDNQMWDLTYGPPYKKTLNERLELVDMQTVQLQNVPMLVPPSSVLLNPNNPGFPPSGYLSITVNDVQVAETGVIDWDMYAGTVKLDRFLSHKDHILGTYIYKEEFYKYQGFVGSGGIYPDTEPFDWVPLDLNPTPDHNYGLYASGCIAHIFLSPYIDITNVTQLTSEALYHNFDGTASGVYDFYLGAVSVGPHCKITDMEITDVRMRGGGLSTLGIKNLDDVMDVQPESEFFWDVGYFDGQAVPSDGALVIRIPKTVLEINGGVFTEDEVRQKVLKHMALGVYPIIEYY